jgi:hypothetical protein
MVCSRGKMQWSYILLSTLVNKNWQAFQWPWWHIGMLAIRWKKVCIPHISAVLFWKMCAQQEVGTLNTIPGFIFSILAFFNKYSRNEPGQKFFPNLALLSRVSLSDHLARLISTWTSDATSIRSVPPQLSVSKMSHAILNGATHRVAPPLLAWLILGQNQPNLISLSFTAFLWLKINS